MTIGNVSVKNVFIVADIVDKVIIGADFMIAHDIYLNMGQQIMSWRNMEIPLYVGYKHQAHTRRIFAIDQQKLPPQSESLIWAYIEGDCEETCCGKYRNTDESNISKGPRQIHRTENSLTKKSSVKTQTSMNVLQ